MEENVRERSPRSFVELEKFGEASKVFHLWDCLVPVDPVHSVCYRVKKESTSQITRKVASSCQRAKGICK